MISLDSPLDLNFILLGAIILILFIFSIIALIKFFQIASNVKKIRQELQEHVLLINSTGGISLAQYKRIDPHQVFIRKNPISGYFYVCVKKSAGKHKIVEILSEYDKARELAIAQATGIKPD